MLYYIVIRQDTILGSYVIYIERKQKIFSYSIPLYSAVKLFFRFDLQRFFKI